MATRQWLFNGVVIEGNDCPYHDVYPGPYCSHFPDPRMKREMRKTGALPGGSFWKYFWGERTCRRVGHDLEVSYFYPSLRSGALVCRRCTRMFEPDWDEWEAVHGRLPRIDNFPNSPVEHW